MNIAYRYGDGLYLNITNRCACACTFCIRLDYEGLGNADSLWMERDPAAEEVKESIRKEDLSEYREIVFCGYGEPTESLEVLLETCRFLREYAPEMSIRLNTNGLADLVNKRSVAPLLEGLVDTVSVSLNAPNARRYMEIVNPAFGEESYQAMLSFARDCKQYVPRVVFTVVDVLEPGEVEQCRDIARQAGIPLRVRQKD